MMTRKGPQKPTGLVLFYSPFLFSLMPHLKVLRFQDLSQKNLWVYCIGQLWKVGWDFNFSLGSPLQGVCHGCWWWPSAPSPAASCRAEPCVLQALTVAHEGGLSAVGVEPVEEQFLDKSPTITACPIALSDINRDFLEGGQILGQGKKNTGRGKEEDKLFRILIQQQVC